MYLSSNNEVVLNFLCIIYAIHQVGQMFLVVLFCVDGNLYLCFMMLLFYFFNKLYRQNQPKEVGLSCELLEHLACRVWNTWLRVITVWKLGLQSYKKNSMKGLHLWNFLQVTLAVKLLFLIMLHILHMLLFGGCYNSLIFMIFIGWC